MIYIVWRILSYLLLVKCGETTKDIPEVQLEVKKVDVEMKRSKTKFMKNDYTNLQGVYFSVHTCESLGSRYTYLQK